MSWVKMQQNWAVFEQKKNCNKWAGFERMIPLKADILCSGQILLISCIFILLKFLSFIAFFPIESPLISCFF